MFPLKLIILELKPQLTPWFAVSKYPPDHGRPLLTITT
jgi:hypothetical protein